MYRWHIFFTISALIMFLLFLPDIMPRCSCCGRLKPRPFIRIHRGIGMNPGYRGNRSVCTKCCRKYDIESLSDLDRIADIKRKLRLNALKTISRDKG